jgi:hypothetical protein
MRELAVACGLVDIWARRNPGIEFNTRHPGSKRIDYVLVTPDIVPSVTAVGYFPFKYRGQSDHRSIYVDFDTALLFGNETSKLANLQQRGLVSTDPFSCTQYIRAAGKHAHANNLFELSLQLSNLTEPDHALAEKVDTILGQAMAHGDKQCKHRRTHWWSQKLHCLRLWRSVLYRLLSGFKTDGDFQDTLNQILTDHGMHDKVIPDNLHDCRRTITLITTDIKASCPAL